MVTYRQIAAFRAVMLTHSFTRAADMLHITQPAISRLIRDLEIELKLTLFERQKGGMKVTRQAETLYSEVERSFLGLQRIEQAARRIREGRSGAIKICGNPAFTLMFIPRVVKAFLETHEGVQVSLYSCANETAFDLILARQFDLGYVITPADIAGIEAGPVQHARCVCLLPPGHRLSDRDVVRIEDLKDEPFISLAEGTMTRMKIDAAFNAANIPRRLEIEAEWSATICAMVANGLGVSIIEPFTAESFVQNGGVTKPFLPEIDYTFTQIRKAGTPRAPLAEDFMATFDACVGDFARPRAAPG